MIGEIKLTVLANNNNTIDAIILKFRTFAANPDCVLNGESLISFCSVNFKIKTGIIDIKNPIKPKKVVLKNILR